MRKIKEIDQLRVGLIPLTQHKYLHNFSIITDGAYICGRTEDTTHFFRECPLFLTQRRVFPEIYRLTDLNLFLVPKDHMVNILLYGSKSLTG